MYSAGLPVIVIVIGILCAYGSAGGFSNVAMGLYGIGFAAVGMLATLGITLATDAYGPIADNAGGNAEMSGLGEEVRKRTDASIHSAIPPPLPVKALPSVLQPLLLWRFWRPISKK